MEVWCTDVGNAHLESYAQEKVHIVAGPDFGDHKGHTLIVQKALHGLKSSGKRWSERCAECLRSMNFQPCKAENDAWMREAGDHCECVAVYVDDLLIVSRDPQSIIDSLRSQEASVVSCTEQEDILRTNVVTSNNKPRS